MITPIQIDTNKGTVNTTIDKEYQSISIVDVRRKVNQSDCKGAEIIRWFRDCENYYWL